MAGRIATPGRLRRRVAVSFVAVTLAATGALAGASYGLVRTARLDESTRRAISQTRLNLTIARRNLPSVPDADALRGLLATLDGGGFDTLLASPQGSLQSALTLGRREVPSDLAGLVAAGKLAYERTSVDGRPYLVTGTSVPGTGTRAFFFFGERQIHSELAQLGRTLAAGVVAFTALAAIVGAVLARRVLEPVAKASAAAQSLAEGLLTTRLPVDTADEFGAWAAAFNEMAEALEDKIEALSAARERERRFTSDVAHELRTPLTALVNEAALLEQRLDDVPAESRRVAELLVADVGRLRQLVEDLMEVSRLDAGHENVAVDGVDIEALVRAAVEARGWSGEVDILGGAGPVITDRHRVERVVANLVGNAIEHGGGRATVAIGRDDDHVFVEVSDRGPGIAPEHLAHVFDRFYKADASRRKGGSGLGLAIARDNARLLKGDIDVVSELGSGTRFTLRLPVTQRLPDRDGPVAPRRDDDGVTSTEGGTQ